MRFQRLLQIPLFLFFLFLLWLASFPLPQWVDVRMFLKLDPLVSLGTMALARAFLSEVAWGLLFIGVALVLGRVFCGYLCPMGATADFADWLGRKQWKKSGRKLSPGSRTYRNWKYLILAALLGSSLLGVGYHGFFSPLSLITRFYGLVLYPVLSLITGMMLTVIRPLFVFFGWESLSFAQVKVHYFNTNLFVAALVLGILLLGFIQPRFWCRNLCPSGAILALFSCRPLFRRFVSDACTGCGRCLRSCPTAAVSDDFVTTTHSECITCLKCREVCPEGAVSFRYGSLNLSTHPEINLSRRKFVAAGLTGVTFSAITMTNVHHLHGSLDPRAVRSSSLIRPPGALPEPTFQNRCIRCGECVKGCPTNTLQLVWWEAGISGLWTPKIMPRLAGCEQNCNLCGNICPTGAIRPLSMEEKPYAKLGTARVVTSRCIAWEQNKRCLICDEICPYNAISSQFTSGRSVTVPVVDENKCNGCGYCESKCPVEGDSAIVVEPLGEVRLASGSYKEKAEELGLIFHAGNGVEDQFILTEPGPQAEHRLESLPQGSPEKPTSLPPGFTVDPE